MRSTVLAFLLLSARGGVAALAAWLWQLHRRGRRAMMLQAAAVLLLPVLLTQGVKTGIRASR